MVTAVSRNTTNNIVLECIVLYTFIHEYQRFIIWLDLKCDQIIYYADHLNNFIEFLTVI